MNYRYKFMTAFLLPFLSMMCNGQTNNLAKEIEQIENGLMTSIIIKGKPIPKFSIHDRMKYHKIHGLSIVFIENNEIKWARQYGVKEAGKSDPITRETMFQVGSVSKPVAAVVALSLVKQREIELDKDVKRYLKSWEIPDSKYLKEDSVTLRRILSHNAGITNHGFAGYQPNAEIPTLIQILNGEKPAKNKKIQVDTVPGSIWRYSGGGYTIMQQMLEDVSGITFGKLAQEQLFDKISMEHSTYSQPVVEEFADRTAKAHNVFGGPLNKNLIQPELAAGGLWSTPNDLARLMIELMKEYEGKSDMILNKELATQMFKPQFKNWSLGLSINKVHFSHSGSCEGFRTILSGNKDKGQGVVMMTNGENGDNLMREIMNSMAEIYDWSYISQQEREVYDVDEDTYKKYSGKYQVNPQVNMEVRYEEDLLKVYINGDFLTTIYPESENKFFILEDRHVYTFILNEDGSVKGMSILGLTPRPLRAKKVL